MENSNCLYEMALVLLENVRKEAGEPEEIEATVKATNDMFFSLGPVPTDPGHEETIRYVIGAPEIRELFGVADIEEKLPGRLIECSPILGYLFYIDKVFPANTCMIIEDNGGEALVVLKHARFKSDA